MLYRNERVEIRNRKGRKQLSPTKGEPVLSISKNIYILPQDAKSKWIKLRSYPPIPDDYKVFLGFDFTVLRKTNKENRQGTVIATYVLCSLKGKSKQEAKGKSNWFRYPERSQRWRRPPTWGIKEGVQAFMQNERSSDNSRVSDVVPLYKKESLNKDGRKRSI